MNKKEGLMVKKWKEGMHHIMRKIDVMRDSSVEKKKKKKTEWDGSWMITSKQKYKQSCTFLEQKKITKVDDYSTPIEGKTKSWKKIEISWQPLVDRISQKQSRDQNGMHWLYSDKVINKCSSPIPLWSVVKLFIYNII